MLVLEFDKAVNGNNHVKSSYGRVEMRSSCVINVDEVKNKSYPPALHSPIPPGQARTKFGSANKDTGLNAPDSK